MKTLDISGARAQAQKQKVLFLAAMNFIWCLTFPLEFDEKTQNQKANWLPILQFFHHLFLPPTLGVINEILGEDSAFETLKKIRLLYLMFQVYAKTLSFISK